MNCDDMVMVDTEEEAKEDKGLYVEQDVSDAGHLILKKRNYVKLKLTVFRYSLFVNLAP